MPMPFYPPTDRREFGDVITSEEQPYVALDGKKLQLAAFYAIALQNSIEDATDILEPQLPPEARPYVEVFERYLMDRAEHYMQLWRVDPPGSADEDVTPR